MPCNDSLEALEERFDFDKSLLKVYQDYRRGFLNSLEEEQKEQQETLEGDIMLDFVQYVEQNILRVYESKEELEG